MAVGLVQPQPHRRPEPPGHGDARDAGHVGDALQPQPPQDSEQAASEPSPSPTPAPTPAPSLTPGPASDQPAP